jgi:ABC-type branched-subunit amino acid transport system ATPase component/ABC-type branched-subunit amino acid transport system permease subunit
LPEPSLAFEIPRQVVFTGAVTGFTYGVLAVGLVLVFRSTQVVNFAHGEIGALAAALLGVLVINYGIDYWLALAIVVAGGAALGAALELIIVRRLFTAPRVILFVATLGAAQLVFLLQFVLPDLKSFRGFPTPIHRRWEFAGLTVRGEHLLVLVVVPAMTLALAWFLERTRYGKAIRASAANPDAARLSAIRIKTMSTLVWVLAGVIATVTAVLVAPLRGTTAGVTEALGPSLLLRALAAALIGRMRSLPLALAGGTAIGVAEALLFYNSPEQPGLIDALLFVVVLVTVLSMVRRGRSEEGGRSFSFSPRVKPVPAVLRDEWWVRRLPWITGAAALVLAVVLPIVVTAASRQFLYSRMLLYALVALSLTVLTGWAGQLSLGQFAFVGVSAMTTAALVNGTSISFAGQRVEIPRTPFEVAALVGTAVTVLVAMVVGLPALRVRGLLLAITTLAFAVMAQTWLLARPFFTRGQTIVVLPRAHWGHAFSLAPQRTYYYVCLVALLICAVALRRVRNSGIGRSLIAVRDNENGAAAFTVSPVRAKLMAFGIAGALAGIAGALLAGLLVQVGPDTFTPTESLRAVAIAVIGGLSTIPGAVLGSVWVIGLPAAFTDSDQIRLLTSGAGLLILLLYFPGGLAQVGYSVRDWAFARAAARRPAATAQRAAAARIPARPRTAAPPLPPGPALRTDGVTVRFGGRVAVAGVDLTVGPGEVVGLIGTNGAGKSTFMNAVGGFVPCEGRIEVLGRDVGSSSPARRAALGLGRTFQGADLFPDLTVRETLAVALEARGRTTLPATLLGLPRARRAERARRQEAEELVAFFGLGGFGDRFVSELSTGTRRIVELACLLALDARLLCLDEPTAGVAQRETEAFAPLVMRIREELGAALLVIEHDMPFIMGISDRVYCLEAGAVIAEGAPEDVRRDPQVIASYLGTDERAIRRSGAIAANDAPGQ